MDKIIEIFIKNNQILKKFPIAINGNKINLTITTNPICAKCTNNTCFASIHKDEFVCDQKISSYNIQLKSVTISTYGHIGDLSTLKKGHYAYKKISKLKYTQFHSMILELLQPLEKELESFEFKVKTNILNSFHDASKWARQISLNAEHMLNKLEGNSIAEKFRSADSHTKAIYKCSTLLNEALQSYEIFMNPENVDFGAKSDTQIYQLFDKFQAILYNSEGKKINRSFSLKGNSYTTIKTYQSFTTIPLSLLHNALKYSIGNEKIEISFTEVSNKLLIVDIVSNGPFIPEEEKVKIFEKNYRGKYASKLHHDGIRIGLYVAQIVAAKHNSIIKVDSVYLGYERDRIPMAKNKFSLQINLT